MKVTVLRRSYVTLIEMMIVMFLIALITGVVAYNYRGSMDEGKAFKTRTAKEKLETILTLATSEDPTQLGSIQSNWKDLIKNSPLVKDADTLIKDGWGYEFRVDIRPDDGAIMVSSPKLDEYEKSKKQK